MKGINIDLGKICLGICLASVLFLSGVVGKKYYNLLQTIQAREIESAYIEGSIKTLTFIDCYGRKPSTSDLKNIKNLDLVMGCDDLVKYLLRLEGKKIKGE